MNAEIARLYAVIGANIEELERKLGTASGDLNRFRGEAETAGVGVTSVFERIGTVIAGILGARLIEDLIAKIQQIGMEGFQATAEWQAAEVGMEGLLAREIAKAAELQGQVMTIGDAMPQAAQKAGQFMEQLAKIAIYSPYQLGMVQQTFRQAMAFGYTSQEALQFTRAMLNVAAGTGATNEMMGRMAYNLAQIHMVGKVTAMDMRQLAMAGFDLTGVLQYVGQKHGVLIKTYDDFNKAIEDGRLTWATFTQDFEEYADRNFGGASQRMSTTIMGLQSTIKDLVALSFPQMLLPAFDEVNPRLSEFLNLFVDLRDSGVFKAIGESLRTQVVRWLQPVDRILSNTTRWREAEKVIKGLGQGEGPRGNSALQQQLAGARQTVDDLTYGLGFLGLIMGSVLGPGLMGKIAGPIRTVRDYVGGIHDALKEIGQGNIRQGLEALGLPEWVILAVERGAVAFDWIKRSVLDLATGKTTWQQVLSSLGFSEPTIRGIERVAAGVGDIVGGLTKNLSVDKLSSILEQAFGGGGGQKYANPWIGQQDTLGQQMLNLGSQVGGAFLDGLRESWLHNTEALNAFTESFEKWTEDPKTQAAFRNIAHNITKTIIGGIVGDVSGPDRGLQIIRGMTTNLVRSVMNWRQGWINIGSAIGMGIIDGLFPGANEALKKKIADAYAEWIYDATQVLNPLFNVLKLFAEGKESWDNLMNALKGFTSKQQGSDNGPGYSSFAQGGTFVTDGPQWLLVGDNRSGRERVTVEPLPENSDFGRSRGGNVTVNIDARGAQRGVGAEVERSVRQALRAAGYA